MIPIEQVKVIELDNENDDFIVKDKTGKVISGRRIVDSKNIYLKENGN